MTADLAVADALVWVAAHGIQIAVTVLLYLTWRRSPSQRLRRRNAELDADLAAARLAHAQEQHNATFAMQVANRAIHDRALLAGQVDRMREQAQAIDDRVACMQLDWNTNWERM
jgi:hypothetical protein